MCGNFGLLFIKNQSNKDAEQTEDDAIAAFSPKGVHPQDSAMAIKHTRKVSFHETDQSRDFSFGSAACSKKEYDEVTLQDVPEVEEPQSPASHDPLINPLLILEAQAANTEIRGGQAGGYSSIQYERVKNLTPAALHPTGEQVNSPFHISNHSASNHCSSQHSSKIGENIIGPSGGGTKIINIGIDEEAARSPLHNGKTTVAKNIPNSAHNVSAHSSSVHSQQGYTPLPSSHFNFTPFEAEYLNVPLNIRVRTVARKRHPLAADLTKQFVQAREGKTIELDNTFTGELLKQCCCIGDHTICSSK